MLNYITKIYDVMSRMGIYFWDYTQLNKKKGVPN